MIDNVGIDDAFQRIREAVGADNFTTDEEELTYFSQDYFNRARPATAVIQPRSKDALAKALAAATSADIAVFPRGGGYSYTDAYLPTRWPCILIDTRHMNRIIEINEQDMFVTAECGCTWAELDTALAKKGLRTPFRGPQSGRNATLGGGISQGANGFGSGLYGISAESVVGMEVALADGTILTTGSAGQPSHNAFFRHYGPDLTGLFCGDAGALGVKLTATLRLLRRPALVDGLSFGCRSFEDSSACMAAIAREGIASASYGIPVQSLVQAMEGRQFKQDLVTLWQVGRTGTNPVTGLMRMIKIGVNGRRFIKNFEQSVHFELEAPNNRILTGQIAHVRKIAGRFGAEIPNSIPLARMAEPFGNHSMMSPSSQRQLPFHAIFPFSKANAFHKSLQHLYERNSDNMQKHGMTQISICSSMSTNGFLYEPVLQWHDVPEVFHRRHSDPLVIEKAEANQTNLEARELASALRDQIIDVMYDHGGVHLQIGKVYPYARDRDSTHKRALGELKRFTDPKSLINPGGLGLS